MTHISFRSFVALHDNGTWRLPQTMHSTYCGRIVLSEEIASDKEADCDQCQEAKSWEEIDLLTREADRA